MVLVDIYDYGMGALGGFILSLSCILHLLLKGRITGISGILYGMFINIKAKTPNEFFWRFCFILGMLFTSSLFRFSLPLDSILFEKPEKFLKGLSLLGYFISGVLVGFGTKLANGCTSGHGLSGLARLSKRSFLSVFLFLSFAIGIATLRYNYKFLNDNENDDLIKIAMEIYNPTSYLIYFCIFSFIFLCLIFYLFLKSAWENVIEFLISFFSGSLFSIGLIISGMNKRSKVINFLTIYENWDPSLMFVLFTGSGFNLFAFWLIKKYNAKPYFSEKFSEPKKSDIDLRLIFGSIIFGLGWGISGLCPGPGIVTFFIYIPHLILFFISLILGAYLCILFEMVIEKFKNKNYLGDNNNKKEIEVIENEKRDNFVSDRNKLD
jgi:uncharacterized membrane protein YedE/YeeE